VAIEVRWGSATHAGCVRTQNQDATLCGPELFVVADGMGGHAAGDVASGIAISELSATGDQHPICADDVIASIRRANRTIFEAAAADPTRAHMGTTVAGVALVRDHRVLVFNVGDSRVYRWHEASLRQVSSDHSVIGELLAAGEIGAEDAGAHPQRHVVTRALGVSTDVDIDSWILEAIPGDRFLVCSDGLTNEITDAELTAWVAGSGADPQRAVEALLHAALDRGARDNVSILLVEIAGVDVAADATEANEDTNPRLVVAEPPRGMQPAGSPARDGDPSDARVVITGVPSFEAHVAR
jgi:protein phosphatase